MGNFESIYIHIPFCDVICHYCDFYTARSKDARQAEFFSALKMELKQYLPQLAPLLKTIYFGGGTPGVSPPDLLHDFLQQLQPYLSAKTEISLEVNPNNVSTENVRLWKQAGFNRISMGVQSLQDELLKKLGRTHGAAQAKEMLLLCLNEFENVSADLIYAVPTQSVDRPAEDALELADLGLKHISAYHLTLTKEHFLYPKLPSDEIAFQQIEKLSNSLCSRGFQHYEISNFGHSGRESKHNQNYWLGGPYLALGPSAHGYNGKNERWRNIADWERYFELLQEGHSAVEGRESLSMEQRKIEYLFTHLRLETGINISEFKELFGSQLDLEKASLFQELEKAGLGSLKKGYFRPTFRGRMLGDEIVRKFL